MPLLPPQLADRATSVLGYVSVIETLLPQVDSKVRTQINFQLIQIKQKVTELMNAES